MKKFQVLFAMLFVALTFSLTSCSDDATSAPASPFTKSASQPDSYMPLNVANTWKYDVNTVKIHKSASTTNTYKDTTLVSTNILSGSTQYTFSYTLKNNISNYFMSNAKFDASASKTIMYLVDNGSASPMYNLLSNGTVEIVNATYYSTYKETIQFNNSSVECQVVVAKPSENDRQSYYYAKGYGTVKYVCEWETASEKFTSTMNLISCSLK